MATMTPRQRSLMAAAGRGRVRLRFMARGMSRADRNQSSADPVRNRGGAIAWTVDLHLPFLIDSNAALSPVTLHGIPDSAPLDRMVAAILDPAHPLALAHPALHVALSAHSSALLVPADPEQSESSSPYWYLRRPLPPSGQDARRLHVPLGDGATTTLAAALAGLPVYEYPALVLTLLPLDPTDMVLPRAIGDDDADEPSAAAARNGGGDDEDDEEEEGEVSEHALPPPTLTSLPRPPAATRVSARPSMQQHQQQQHHQHHQQRRSTSSVSYQDLNNIWAKLGQSLGADAEGQVQAAFAADLEDEDEDEDDS
ncbi:hypothetical protein BC828DRAFT_261923 [Blastocladiella britannica]|nr:hypothetical protein BC828DRAFT_261923 [Blastocladiella britannica]